MNQAQVINLRSLLRQYVPYYAGVLNEERERQEHVEFVTLSNTLL
jgi:hypothetical protein